MNTKAIPIAERKRSFNAFSLMAVRAKDRPSANDGAGLVLERDRCLILSFDGTVRSLAQRTNQTGLLCRLLRPRRKHDVESALPWPISLRPWAQRIDTLRTRPRAVIVWIRLITMCFADPAIVTPAGTRCTHALSLIVQSNVISGNIASWHLQRMTRRSFDCASASVR